MKNILVTGGAGFIGSHAVVELIESGYNPIVFDNFYNSDEKALEGIKKITGKEFTFFKGDICVDADLEKVFSENKIDAVIHFAGYKAVGESVAKPLEYYDNNISGTIKLLQAMKKYNCKKIVFSSSATVYGPKNQVPYTEDMDTSATNPYGWTKVMIEQILRDVCVADSEFSAMLLRYFNPIGAHESGLIGENPNGIPNNLVPYIAKVAIGQLESLSVFGDDYDTPDGTGLRDYIHVVDLAQGHIVALNYVFENVGSCAVNLGTGTGTSVIEVADAYEKASGVKIKRNMAPRRAGDIARCYANTDKAEKLFDWKAKYGIEKMCLDSWNFIQKQH